MTTAQLDLNSSQIPMPGLIGRRTTGSASVSPGQAVQYHGSVRGGPRFGLYGTVVEVRARQAVVDMGQHGRWHIPYYLLTLPQTNYGGIDAVQVA